MSVWALLLRKIHHIHFAAYIDDSYIWTRLEHVQLLKKALDVTDLWDSSTGQNLNKKKCQVFATSTCARRKLKGHFPELDHAKVITVLGANLNVTNNNNTLWPPEKSQKIIRNLKSIRAIPCSRDVLSHLVATKVIPQLTYMPSLSSIPKKFLQLAQDEIASSLWKNRPMWRSRWLVLGLLSSPHRTEPFLARAFVTILETMNFLKVTGPSHRQIWERQVLNDFVCPNSLVASFQQACSVVGIKLIAPFCVQISAIPNVHIQILDTTKRDLKKLLCNLCKQQCYRRACEAVRKDILPPKSILDVDITMAARPKLKNQIVDGMKLTSIRDSTMVGCTITNDRSHKAGLTNDCACRFCGFEKESMLHLVDECKAIPGCDTKPTCPDWLGPILGVAEIDHNKAFDWLKSNDIMSVPVEQWSASTKLRHTELWTDGSCEFSELYWHTVGAFAVIDCHDNTLYSGEVCHFTLSSFTCELWAIAVHFCVQMVL